MHSLKSKVFVAIATVLMIVACSKTSQEVVADSSVDSGSAYGSDAVVLVTGITGNQGGGVATALLERGIKVRGLSRNIESDASKELVARGVEMVQGDFTDYDTITAAVQGVDHLFLNITERTPDFINAAKHAIDSAYAAGALHVVFTSNRPADPESGFNVNADRTKRQIELHLRASGGSYTTLRIPFMMENLLRERDMNTVLSNGLIDYGEKETYGYYMNSADMGLLAAAAFADPASWNGREVNMASDALKPRELAALITELSGIEVGFRMAPWSEMRGPFVANFKWFEEGNPSYDMEQLKQEFPQIQSLEQYLRSNNYGEKLRALAK